MNEKALRSNKKILRCTYVKKKKKKEEGAEKNGRRRMRK